MEDANYSYPKARRNARMPLTLVLAIIVGVIAAVKFDSIKALFARAGTGNPPRRVAGPNDAVVPIAATKIQPGTMITAHMLTKGIVPKRALENEELQTESRTIVGRVARTELEPGLPIMDRSLSPRGRGEGFQSLIPPGFVSTQLDQAEIDGQLEFLRSSDSVALLTKEDGRVIWLSTKAKVLIPLKITRFVEQTEARVTPIVARKGSPAIEKYKAEGKLTLALPPEEMSELLRYRGKTKIHVTLMGRDDVVTPPQTQMDALAVPVEDDVIIIRTGPKGFIRETVPPAPKADDQNQKVKCAI